MYYNYLYIAGQNNFAGLNTQIQKINPITMSIEATSNITGMTSMLPQAIFEAGNKLYAAYYNYSTPANSKIYELDKQTLNLLASHNISIKYNDSVTVDKNYIYTTVNGSYIIYKYNISDFSIAATYTGDSTIHLHDGFKGICIDDNYLYFTTDKYIGKLNKSDLSVVTYSNAWSNYTQWQKIISVANNIFVARDDGDTTVSITKFNKTDFNTAINSLGLPTGFNAYYITTDGKYIYFTTYNEYISQPRGILYKYDLNLAYVTQSSAIGLSGSYDAIITDSLYNVNNFNSSTDITGSTYIYVNNLSGSQQRISKFNTNDLSLVNSTNISYSNGSGSMFMESFIVSNVLKLNHKVLKLNNRIVKI